MPFIKLDKKLLKWGWKDDPNMVALWIEILLQANWEDHEWHGQIYEKGSFPTSLSNLASNTGLTIQNVRTCLKNLEKSGEITQISTKSGTKIIVNKWADYQGYEVRSNTDDNKEPTKSQQTPNKQLTTLKEYKTYKNERNIYNSVPVYDPSKNEDMDEDMKKELLILMGRA